MKWVIPAGQSLASYLSIVEVVVSHAHHLPPCAFSPSLSIDVPCCTDPNYHTLLESSLLLLSLEHCTGWPKWCDDRVEKEWRPWCRTGFLVLVVSTKLRKKCHQEVSPNGKRVHRDHQRWHLSPTEVDWPPSWGKFLGVAALASVEVMEIDGCENCPHSRGWFFLWWMFWPVLQEKKWATSKCTKALRIIYQKKDIWIGFKTVKSNSRNSLLLENYAWWRGASHFWQENAEFRASHSSTTTGSTFRVVRALSS